MLQVPRAAIVGSPRRASSPLLSSSFNQSTSDYNCPAYDEYEDVDDNTICDDEDGDYDL